MHPVICGLTNGVTCIPRYPAPRFDPRGIGGEKKRSSLDRFDFYPSPRFTSPTFQGQGRKGWVKEAVGADRRGRSERRGAERDPLIGYFRYNAASLDTIEYRKVGKFARVGVRKNIIRSWIRKGVDSTPTTVPDGRSLAYSSSSLLYCLPYMNKNVDV